MSTNAVELALWTITTRADEAERFKNDRAGFLCGYRLDDAETCAIVEEDVRSLKDRNVNDMLVFAFFQVLHGRQNIPAYLEKMRPR